MDAELQATVENWIARVCADLDLPVPDDYTELLEIARICAHEVARPTAPITTYLAGLAAARGMDPGQVRMRVAALASEG